MGFLQFFIWGAWLITIGSFWFQYKNWDNTDFGIIFSTMGLASLFMPALMGILADRRINAEKLYGILHIGGALCLFVLPSVETPKTFFWVMFLNMVFYMPTLALAITVAYTALKKKGADVVRSYPPIRVWGTVGFIVQNGQSACLVLKPRPTSFTWPAQLHCSWVFMPSPFRNARLLRGARVPEVLFHRWVCRPSPCSSNGKWLSSFSLPCCSVRPYN